MSPFCVGATGSLEAVLAAYDAGINFFFISADLHWPVYEHARRGLAELLARGGSIRDEIVVGVVSYLDQPLFGALQFQEVINAVPGLERVDLLIAGAVSHESGFGPRLRELAQARARGLHGARAIGASFHHRGFALLANNHNLLDISYVRYNPAHPGARQDLFPLLQPYRSGLLYNFKSTASHVSEQRFRELGLSPERQWLPSVTDHYRFVLSQQCLNGILFSPKDPSHIDALRTALEKGPLRPEEEHYMISLSSMTFA